MKKNNRDKKKSSINHSGIVLTNEIRISPYSCENFPVSMAVLQHFFIILSVASVLYSFIDRFEFSVEKFWINLVIVFTTIVVYQIFMVFRKYRKVWPLLSLLLIIVIAIIYRIEHLKESFYSALSVYLKCIQNYYMSDTNIVVEKATYYEGCTELFLYIAIFMVFVITYVVTCYMSKGIYFLCTLPWIFLSFIVGYVPAAGPLYIYIISTIAIWGAGVVKGNYCVRDTTKMTCNNIKQKNFKDIAAVKIGTTMFIVISVLYIIAFMFYPKNNFNDKSMITELRQIVQKKIDTTANDISVKVTGKKISNTITDSDSSLAAESNLNNFLSKIGVQVKNAGGISEGKFGNADGIEFLNIDMLTVTTTYTNQILYLKGYVGLEYNKGWVAYSGDDYSANDYSIENTSYGKATEYNKLNKKFFTYGIIDIKNISENATYNSVIVPYSAGISTEIESDGTISSPNKQCTGYYVYNFDDISTKIDDFDDAGIFSKKNTDSKQIESANEKYTTVPESISDTINKTINKIDYVSIDRICDYYSEGTEDKCQATINIVEAVRDYLKSNYIYDLTPGKVTNGSDPVEYFLNNSKKGYCMYFAAAATAIFRAYGIPARYVEGYVVTPSDFEHAQLISNGTLSYQDISTYMELDEMHMYKMNIKDTNSHAWVEIYMDNFGWVPVEVTGNTVNGNSVPDIIAGSYAYETPKPAITLTPNKQPNQPQITQTKEPVETKKVDKSKDSISNKIVIVIAFVIGTIIIVIAAVYCMLIIIKNKKDSKYKLIRDSNSNMTEYISVILNKIFKEDRIIFKNDMDYKEYAKKIADNYIFLEKKKVYKCVELIIKEKFSENGISIEEFEIIKDFYNTYMENIVKSWSPTKLWYYTNIQCIKFKI